MSIEATVVMAAATWAALTVGSREAGPSSHALSSLTDFCGATFDLLLGKQRQEALDLIDP
jgi:hypothetical protein